MRISDWTSDVCSSDLRSTARSPCAAPSGSQGSTLEKPAWLSPAAHGSGVRAPSRDRESGQFLSASGSFTISNGIRSEEHTSELQSLMRISYAVFCLKKNTHEKDRKRNEVKYKHY